MRLEMKDTYSYIEFEILDPARFSYLQRFFCQLQEIKSNCLPNINLEHKQEIDYSDPVDSFPWRDLLDDKAVEWFENCFDFNSQEGAIYWQLWELTAPEIRLQHSFFKTPGNWDFESMLDAIFNGDYVLIDLVREQEDRGCLYFEPRAYPFGGSDSLVELIHSFGNLVTYDSWHKNNHPQRVSAWNYELAKKLVRQGIGFRSELLAN